MTEEAKKQEQKVETMSHRQLRSELKKLANRSYEGKSFIMNGVDFGDRKSKNNAGVLNAEAIVNLIVLDNTKIEKVIEFHENGNPKRFTRKDQFGPGKLNAYPV
jgi:hypothetical protein